jgi:predicted transport protein
MLIRSIDSRRRDVRIIVAALATYSFVDSEYPFACNRITMPLFQLKSDIVTPVPQIDFENERTLQRLVEKNLKVVFNCRLVATEFSTGAVHAGRIDTLALSEDGNPVIIEYKRVASSELINQSLFYLAWLRDHHGDFEVAARKALEGPVEIDWSDIRVICLAPNYKKYDLHAVQVMGANIELWTYRLYANGAFYIEEVYLKSLASPSVTSADGSGKNPVMVAAGKKAAVTKALGGWTFEWHLEGKPPHICELLHAVQEYMLSLDSAMEEAPKKLYVAYRTTQNIVCAEPQKQKILLFLKLDPKKHPGPEGISRDVSKIGHFGTGDLEITVKSPDDLERAKPYMKRAYEVLGG